MKKRNVNTKKAVKTPRKELPTDFDVVNLTVPNDHFRMFLVTVMRAEHPHVFTTGSYEPIEQVMLNTKKDYPNLSIVINEVQFKQTLSYNKED